MDERIGPWPRCSEETVMGNSQDRCESSVLERSATAEPGQAGLSGEGAASALEQLISQNERPRQQNGQADPGYRSE